MAMTIRMARVGRKKLPQYRIVVTDTRSPRDGRFIEILGTYYPLPKETQFKIDAERLQHFVKNGATVSDTVRNLCKKQGVKLSA